jgi:hypothetical protein
MCLLQYVVHGHHKSVSVHLGSIPSVADSLCNEMERIEIVTIEHSTSFHYIWWRVEKTSHSCCQGVRCSNDRSHVRLTSGSSYNNQWKENKENRRCSDKKFCLDTSHHGLFSMLQEIFSEKFINCTSVN